MHIVLNVEVNLERGCHNYAYHILGGLNDCSDIRLEKTQCSSHPVEEWEKVIWTTIRMRNQWLHLEGVYGKHKVHITATKGCKLFICYNLSSNVCSVDVGRLIVATLFLDLFEVVVGWN